MTGHAKDIGGARRRIRGGSCGRTCEARDTGGDGRVDANFRFAAGARKFADFHNWETEPALPRDQFDSLAAALQFSKDLRDNVG
jgi:hypothetical protein